ncbi:hypothetical protein KUF83_06100 [Streptomyces sp. BV286]|uniref:hypothetical protein n=1 Tax=Streptomyces sp. BV286 TaxID=2849672 RepID=UPI001C2E92AA|nr:hypothetical protein [Streptomyces sp. BV286]MBV1936137.1 hypothetical protein [Streptomyces sp. BV286]
MDGFTAGHANRPGRDDGEAGATVIAAPAARKPVCAEDHGAKAHDVPARGHGVGVPAEEAAAELGRNAFMEGESDRKYGHLALWPHPGHSGLFP